MISLIRNELTKIFKKKSIYITLIIALVFIIFANVIYKMSENMNWYNLDSELSFYEEQINLLDQDDKATISEYSRLKTEIDIIQLIKKYGDMNTWQASLINQDVRTIISEMNYYQYEEKNQAQYEELKKQYNVYIEKFDNGDWKYFAKEDLKSVEADLKDQTELKKQTQNQSELKEIDKYIYNLETEKQILTWRLEKDIPYGNDYWNTAISNYEMAKYQIRDYQDSDDYLLKQEYYTNLETAAFAAYDIENKTTSADSSDARGVLLNIFEEFEIFIIIIGVMIAGTIISEEFSKGTVKLLLIKPYKRTTILTAKFITSIIILILVIIIMMVMQFVVGGIVQGFDSYSTPAVVYNHNTNQVEEIGIIKYLAMQALGKMPIYILLMTLAFSVSTFFTNSALAITIGLLGYMGSPFVNMLGISLKLDWLKFFVTPNWDLTKYFFGGLPDFQGLTPTFSMIVIVVYLIIMLIPTYINFKKKNIKNV